MRSSSALVLVTTLVGCTAGATGTPRDLPDAQTAMSADSAIGDVPPPPPKPTFQIVSPTVDVDANHEITYCYYFRTPNTSDLAIKKWVSRMTPGAHDIVMYLTPGDVQTAGTLSTDKCGFTANGIGPVWAYSATNPDDEMVMPADDGSGAPVGQPIQAGHSAFLQMHFVNSTAAVLHAHVELDAYAYDDGVQVTPAGSFYTYSTKIDLGPAISATVPTTGTVASNDVPPRGCIVPAGSKFYLLSVHTYKQAVHTSIKDGATMVFDSTSWEHPGAATRSAAPFYTFTTGKLSWQCDYVNPNNRRIQSGDDAATSETCMAVGFFFPSPGGAGAFCLDSAMVN